MALNLHTIKLRWILPALYLAALLIQLLGLVAGAGHAPRALEPLFWVVAWPSYVLDLILPRFETSNPLAGLLIFLVLGLATYCILGFLIDAVIKKYRQTRV